MTITQSETETCEGYEVHPAASLFPMMTAEEIDALGEDMLAHGQREHIVMCRGQILDGRNRLRACILKGIKPGI
jgi:ParB-like chromosome segregation protein Spo0J